MNKEEELSFISNQLMLNEERNKSQQLQQQANAMSAPMFDSEENENLIRWQLDIKQELNRIERLLRKQIPKRDKDGEIYYIDPEPEQMILNERGIQEILNILAWYLNKNIILSNFSEKQIDQRMLQFGYEVVDFIYLNYERYGLDTPEKIKHFNMIVMNIINSVEAAYNRALKGGERDSLRTARSVTQTEPLSTQANYPGLPSSKKPFSILKPTTWVRT